MGVSGGDREMRTSAAGAGFASAMSYFGQHGVQTPPPYGLLEPIWKVLAVPLNPGASLAEPFVLQTS